MPEHFPTVTPYGKPMEQKPAPAPFKPHKSAGIPVLDNWKSQKPLVSAMKKLMKGPLRKSASGQRFGSPKLPKPGKKHKVKFY